MDVDGFTCIDPRPDPVEAAQSILSFAKVGAGGAYMVCSLCMPRPPLGKPDLGWREHPVSISLSLSACQRLAKGGDVQYQSHPQMWMGLLCPSWHAGGLIIADVLPLQPHCWLASKLVLAEGALSSGGPDTACFLLHTCAYHSK